MLFRNTQNKSPVKSRLSEFIYKKVKKNFATSKLLLYFAS